MSEQTLEKKTIIRFTNDAIKAMLLLEQGAALFVANEKDEAIMFVARGIKKSLVKVETISGCAKCGEQSPFRYYTCESCGMHYCKSCCRIDQKSVICNNCLADIENFADLEF